MKPTPIKVAIPFTPTYMKGGNAAPSPGYIAGTIDRLVSMHLKSGDIYEDCNVMPNQTNIGANNNKFYKTQLVETCASFYLFTRWGRVGEGSKTQE